MVRFFVGFYLLVQINLVYCTFSNNSRENDLNDELSTIEWMTNLFNQKSWRTDHVQNVSHVCKENIALYLMELEKDAFWANKIFVVGVKSDVNNVTENSDITQMVWITKLFNQNYWNIQNFQNITDYCKSDIDLYLNGLKSNGYWESKIYDASGRYNGQFFFGNDFWLGSSTSCWELTNPQTNKVVPPFPVHFSVATVDLDLTRRIDDKALRQLIVGLCLPSSCNNEDITNLLLTDAKIALTTIENVTVNIVNVRPVPGDYNIFKDFKFFIIGGVALIIGLIIAIATTFEALMASCALKHLNKEIEAQTNNNNELKSGDTTAENKTDCEKFGKSRRNVFKTEYKGKSLQLLLSFSALHNGRKILEVDELPEGSLKCIHGLRFISISWVILVHSYMQVFAIAENKTLKTISERYFFYQTLVNATFSVDTFFFLSGLLVTFLYFRSSKKNPTLALESNTNMNMRKPRKFKNVRKFFLLVFYRLARLTPAYLFVLGLHELFMRYMHNVSVFDFNADDNLNCAQFWWRNALYINIWFPQNEMCMLWTWYLANDTEFYILAVFILIIAVKNKNYFRIAAGIVVSILFLSWLTTFIVADQYEFFVQVQDPFMLFDQLYDKPWLRIGPYLIGMITGWLLFKTECKYPLHWIPVLLGWILSAVIICSLVYGVGKDGIPFPLSCVYASLGHISWGVALGWITFACCTGNGGLINEFLSFRGFLPFSRLSYCAYLVHPMLMCITSLQMDGPLHLHNGIALVIFFGNFVVSFLFAFLISLGFEAPVVRMLKIFIGGRRKTD